TFIIINDGTLSAQTRRLLPQFGEVFLLPAGPFSAMRIDRENRADEVVTIWLKLAPAAKNSCDAITPWPRRARFPHRS
uniref:hypothetical protein n=1 Tax=Klebsiella pneumoniae TaxID=573 RepID=UPI0024DE8AE9